MKNVARSAVVYRTLVSVSAQAPWDHELGLKSIRRCRRYLRPIDRTPHVWFHVFEDNSMKPLERLTHRASFRTGIIVLVAMMCFALSPASARRLASAVLAATAIGGASATPAAAKTNDTAIRPFRVNVPDEALADLRKRVLATRWPDKETVSDRSQGVQLAKLQELVRYWGTDYDWRKVEAKLNALPQFITTIDGLDIHFIHVRSRHPNALAVIITHGWPGSITEQLKVIDPLTDPAAHGGRAQDAFDVVIPSMPGYGFSGKPTVTGWNPDRIARAWAELMKRVGYTRYVAQGGDWGSPISSAMARRAPPGLLGIHINLPATVPPDVAAALAAGGPPPAGLSEKERAAFDSLDRFYKMRRAYGAMMGTRPQVIGQALTDSPAGLAAFMYDYNDGEPERLLTKDDFLDNVTLYWLTNTATSSARLYWETGGQSVLLASAQKTSEITLPVAITVFPEEVYRAPETWARRAYRNLTYFKEVDKGGHFAAWEEPELFAAELRAAFRSIR
jgi:pimeloyl-ACP methyl ester carboxylesterase